MAHTKFPCCILNQAAMAMTVSVCIYVRARARGHIFSCAASDEYLHFLAVDSLFVIHSTAKNWPSAA